MGERRDGRGKRGERGRDGEKGKRCWREEMLGGEEMLERTDAEGGAGMLRGENNTTKYISFSSTSIFFPPCALLFSEVSPSRPPLPPPIFFVAMALVLEVVSIYFFSFVFVRIPTAMLSVMSFFGEVKLSHIRVAAGEFRASCFGGRMKSFA